MKSVFDHLNIRHNNKDGVYYKVIKEYAYFSKRYNKRVVAKVGFDTDGATSALDINSFSWLVHDVLCDYAKFEDGSPCTNWQASQVLQDILKAEGKWFRARTWFWSTWFLGGKKIKSTNGWY